MRSTHTLSAMVLLLVLFFACAPCALAQSDMGYVSVEAYLPESWPTDGSVDLRPMIETALAENTQVFFPGSLDAKQSTIYPMSCGLVVPENRQIRFGPNARFLRIPSKGRMLTLKDGVVLDGVVIDGNKYAHWPEFKTLGKSDAGISLSSNNILTDVVIFNNPGIAFSQWGGIGCKLVRCIAENCGYIDLVYGAMFYQGKWDKHSGDGFYINGSFNILKDCVAYDCSRWAYTTCHVGGSRTTSNNTYVDCKGADVNFLTYGFIDVEGAGENNRFIRCQSPNSQIAIPGSPRTELIQCMASSIHSYDSENDKTVEMYSYGSRGAIVDGCLITGGGKGDGFSIGGEVRGKIRPGGVSSIVTNNRIYKMHPYTSSFSDASFSVHSINGKGTSVVANNILFEYDDGKTSGPGMNLIDIEGVNNKVIYGKWKLDLNIPKHLRYGWYDKPLIHKRNREYAGELLATARESYVADDAAMARDFGWVADIADAKSVKIKWFPRKTAFYIDPDDQGESVGWAAKMPSEIKAVDMDFGQLWGIAYPGFRGPGWSYVSFTWPMVADGQDLYLYLGGIDSEARVFVDGKLIAEHNSWNKPSIHKIDPSLLTQPGKHLFALKMWTTAGQCGSYGPVGLIIVDR